MRAAIKHICKANLRHNLGVLSALAPQSKCIAVVKANAYGCEAEQVFDVLSSADLFAVAEIGEAVKLRQAGADKAILLLEGVFEAEELDLALREKFEPVIATFQQLQWLLDFTSLFPRVWFKLDTGMGRLGFQADNADKAMRQLLIKYSQEQVVIMTHFADADSPERHQTLQQIKCFDAFAARYPRCQQSLSGSAAILAYPEAHRDYIRPGIALYGASPFAGHCGQDHDLKPVMSLKTRVLSVKPFKKDEPIGYGQTYRLPKDGLIAVCEIGYADGYSRFIPSGTPILINAAEYPLVGRVAMDMITVLVDEKVSVGDEVICWGEDLPIERICTAAQTIPHQLLTTVTERPRKVVE
ncbi:MAG: alanine racemase [Gammaproteobacteria bacterium]|nr:MAG: alanine racemase [Gammaproteobacteria bacterium]